MKNKFLSQNEKSASTQPPEPAASSKQTAMAVSPPRDEIIPNAHSRHRQPGAASAFSIKLIAEQASTPAPVIREIHGRRYDACDHWGLNE
jgi:hypothetical protein